MRPGPGYVLSTALALLGGCTSSATHCVAGTTAACACADGRAGAQTCGSDGTFGACTCTTGALDASTPDAAADATAATDGATGVPGLELMARLAGLWTGPATGTPLGDFPVMDIDLRPASDHVLFGRTDLDAANTLRFAFDVETVNGSDVLVYRNGGYFMGVLRDSRTQLVSHDAASDTYRFCAIDRGCDYIDARFAFGAADRMTLDVAVMMAHHLTWTARRAETRAVPTPFPVDATSQGTGTGPFPTLPQAVATVTWTPALTAATTVLVVLTATPCGVAGACTASRTILASAPVGATRAALTIDECLPGAYYANAILDRNGDFTTTLRPDSGDGIAAIDTPVTVAATGTTSATLPIVLTVP